MHLIFPSVVVIMTRVLFVPQVPQAACRNRPIRVQLRKRMTVRCSSGMSQGYGSLIPVQQATGVVAAIMNPVQEVNLHPGHHIQARFRVLDPRVFMGMIKVTL